MKNVTLSQKMLHVLWVKRIKFNPRQGSDLIISEVGDLRYYCNAAIVKIRESLLTPGPLLRIGLLVQAVRLLLLAIWCCGGAKDNKQIVEETRGSVGGRVDEVSDLETMVCDEDAR